MKTALNAIEMTLPEGIQPMGFAGSGFLRAFVWKSEDRCQFSICRENPDTGDIETSFGPDDVVHVVRLMAVVANVFYMTLPDELGNDLGCLAHCLSSSLGFDITDDGGLKRTTKMQ